MDVNKNRKVSRFFEIIAGAVLLPFAIGKFMPVEDFGRSVFYYLGIYPTGQYIVGAIEIIACILLFSKYSSWGTILATWVMMGALIAHLTVLGLDAKGQGYTTFICLLIILSSCLTALYLRRTEIPLLGRYISK